MIFANHFFFKLNFDKSEVKQNISHSSYSAEFVMDLFFKMNVFFVFKLLFRVFFSAKKRHICHSVSERFKYRNLISSKVNKQTKSKILMFGKYLLLGYHGP